MRYKVIFCHFLMFVYVCIRIHDWMVYLTSFLSILSDGKSRFALPEKGDGA